MYCFISSRAVLDGSFLSKLRLVGRPVGIVCTITELRVGAPNCTGFQQGKGWCSRGGCTLTAAAHRSPSSLLSCGKQPHKDSSNTVVCRSEELRLRPQGLRKFLDKVRACAADEGAHQLLLRKATEFAAFLRFREKVWSAQCCSCCLS